ncbi:MAG: Glycosyl transferase family 2 [Oscillospiraceae bacterium]
MKAHIIKDSSKQNTFANKTIQLTGKGPYHGHPIRLTIGLIVKNEEKTLDRCLSSLQPLMQAVESELIITDTGSTDRTVEIAKKYTDHIIHFQWCNDFAAARNTGLKEARGEWFMFLDGDEWFEDTTELIHFFTSGECDKYASAAYIIRNYQDFQGKTYNEFYSPRITRMHPDIRFSGSIHEAIVCMSPTKFLNTCAHHDGYIFRNAAEKQKKSKRNVTMLKQALKDDPENLKLYIQMSMHYEKEDPLLSEKYCKRGLQVEKNHADRPNRLALQQILVRAYYYSKKYEKTLALAEEIIQAEPKMEVIWLDLHGYAQLAAAALGDYERSVNHGKAYLKVYEQYQKGRINKTLELVAIPTYNQPKHRENVLYFLGDAYIHLERFDEAQKVLKQLDYSTEDSIKRGTLLAWRIGMKTERWKVLSEFYQRANEVGEETSRTAMLKSLETVFLEDVEKAQEAVRELASLPDDTDPYMHLNRLRNAETENNHEVILREMDWLFQWEGEWSPIFSDVLYYGMKEKRDLTLPISKIDMDDLVYYIAEMQKRHADYVQVIKEYFKSFSAKTIQGIRWTLALLEKVVLSYTKGDDIAEQIEIFEEYARLSVRYNRMLYSQDVLKPTTVSVLPRSNRFGFYMGLAFSARDTGDDTAYIANMRLALHSYPIMEQPISLMLEDFQKKDKERREKAEEFNMLAKQVKARIRAMIEQGKLKEAGQITAQLAKLLPNDPDVVRFRTLTHTEPNMKEVAAHLPQ